jgi:hypothetical protein
LVYRQILKRPLLRGERKTIRVRLYANSQRRSFLSLRDFAYMQNRPSLISLASSKD